MNTTALMPVYDPLSVGFERGEGVWLWDQNGKQYLDAMSGIGVCALGHSHPAITQAIVEQAKKLLHTSNAFHVFEEEKLAEELTAIASMENAFFCNSGAEANEAAVKLARLYGHHQGIENPAIIVSEQGFYGRTLAMLSASGSRKIQAGFEPLVGGFIRAPFNNLDALRAIAEHGKNIVAVMIEPILGNGGIIIPDDDYLAGVRKICDENNWLMILDEIQTGLGRTGTFYAFQPTKIIPDIITNAKALGNGIPIGACMARGVASKLFQPGKHGSTFGGNPFACHVARTVLKVFKEENVVANSAEIGSYLLHNLKESLSGHAGVVDIRGKGLMCAIEMERPCREVAELGLKHGVVVNITADRVIRLLPPLVLTKQEADWIVERLTKAVAEFV